jgi:hypothetical protein
MDKRAKERVLIAKDALAWIEAGALIPAAGVYVLPEMSPSEEEVKDSNKQLRDVKLGKCDVCAKGCLFLAKAVRYDNVLASQWCKTAEACWPGGVLEEHFDCDQLALIEYTFEGWDYDEQPLNEKANAFYYKYPDTKKRLVAILKNLIKHDGTFQL